MRLLRTNFPSNPLEFSSWVPDFEPITRALQHCRRVLSIDNGKSLHSQLLKHGLCFDVFIANNLIAMYTDFKCYHDAQNLFDEMPNRNVVSWTASISALTHAGNPAKALIVFTQMLTNESEVPNSYTFSAALKACAMVGNLEMGRWIHNRCLERSILQFDTVLVNAVLDMYVKCGRLEEARRVFDGNFPLNSISWNTMLSGYAKGGNLVEAEDLFRRVSEPDAVSFNTVIAGFSQTESPKTLDYVSMMHKQGLKLDHFTFPCALKACGSLQFDNMGRQLHSYIIKAGFGLSSFTGPLLIDMYSKCGLMDEATKLFDEHSNYGGTTCDILLLLNSMVYGFAINGYNERAFDLVSEIHRSGIRLDAFILCSALRVCIHTQNIRTGVQVHGLIVATGYQFNHVVGSVLVDLYAKFGNLQDAMRLFLALPNKDLIAWTGLITSCVQQGSNKLAFSLFREMLRLKIEVDHFVTSGVLKACAAVSWLQGGKQVHAFCIKGGFESESFTVTSLIDMYSKCGDIEDGLKVFESANTKDTICWTGMIVGCGYNGRATEAIELFQRMIESGVELNEVTFVGVLSACRHAGLVGEACRIFETMEEKHGLVPSSEHYCCMIDILRRAGRFEEARKLISVMPYNPNETVWKSLLGPSAVNQNADLCQIPASMYNNTSGCVAMSNVYASMGMWESSAKLRDVMRRVGMKAAGRSWVEVMDRVGHK